MSINVDKFSLIIKNQINKYEKPALLTEFGKVVSVGDGIVKLQDLAMLF